MTETLGILWNTFGLMGIAGGLATTAALVLMVVGLSRQARVRAWVWAAAAAMLAVGFASATSESIRSIEVDRSAEVLAAEGAAAKATQEKFRSRAAGVRFAEDTAADQADIAGVSAAEEEGAYERAMAEELAKRPAYARGGRKARAGSARGERSHEADGDRSKGAGEEPTESAGSDSTPGEPSATDEVTTEARMLPESQLIVADRFDRLNRGVTWGVLCLAVGLVGWEYVRRFNSTFETFWPLPLSGTLIDIATHKQYVLADAAGVIPADAGGLAGVLESFVRKGESFIVFSLADPLADRDRVDRIAARGLRWSLPKRTFAAAEVAADSGLAELVFEAGWFGRGGFVILGSAAADRVLEQFTGMLERRRDCRARAARTLNLVWTLDHAPDSTVATRLARLAAATNIRWLRLQGCQPIG